MKKVVFMLCVGALGLASCSQEDVIDLSKSNDAEGLIAFNARASKPSRAVEITTDNLQDFMVYAFHGETAKWFETPVLFSRSTETSAAEGEGTVASVYFTSDKKYYYPTDGSALTFLAYAPSAVKDEATVVSQTGSGLSVNGFTVKENIGEQLDLIVGATKATAKEADDVTLMFNHALSKVYVSSALNNNGDYTYTVAGVKLGNIAKSGDYAMTYTPDADPSLDHAWTPSETLGDIVYLFDNPIEIGSSTTALMTGGLIGEQPDNKGAFLMVPQALNYEEASGNPDEGGNITRLVFKEGVSYIGLLVRIVHRTGTVIYPYAQGTENVSETIDGVKYAWAAFPVASTWNPGMFIDYFVDFTDGAGFIPAEAEGYDDETGTHVDLKFKPILGSEIRFMEIVGDWNDKSNITIGHAYESIVDGGGENDPFQDF